jgi:hypothetical protein
LTISVPVPFARALLADLREPADDDERDSITDPEQLDYEAQIDASIRQWLRELDGPGDRTLTVARGGPREYFDDEMRGSILEGLTGRLHYGSTAERLAVVAALAGWVDVMGQIERGAACATT